MKKSIISLIVVVLSSISMFGQNWNMTNASIVSNIDGVVTTYSNCTLTSESTSESTGIFPSITPGSGLVLPGSSNAVTTYTIELIDFDTLETSYAVYSTDDDVLSYTNSNGTFYYTISSFTLSDNNLWITGDNFRLYCTMSTSQYDTYIPGASSTIKQY